MDLKLYIVNLKTIIMELNHHNMELKKKLVT